MLQYPNIQLLTKQCRACKEIQPLYMFYIISKTKPHLLQSDCKTCQANLWTKRKNNSNNNKTPESRKRARHRHRTLFQGYMKYTTNNAKMRAKKKNIPFDIDYSFLIDLWNKQDGTCVLSGFDLHIRQNIGDYKRNPLVASLDRIDNTRGYTKDNVRWVCAFANMMKNEYTEDKFREYIEAIYRTLNSPPQNT